MVNSRRLRNFVTAGLAVLLLCGGLSAGSSTRRASDGLLRIVPGKSLFCVRVNKFENTIEAVNEFLKDVAPVSFDAETEVFSKLGELLGDDNLRGINRKGNVAIFGMVVQGEQAGGHPMANMFIGALVPVRNYDKFISGNPNCGEPDGEGISTITLEGRPLALATNLRRFAIVCAPNAREKLSRVKELIDQVKSGGPKEIGSEMKAVLDMIPKSKEAEAVGTFNYVRIHNMLPKMMFGADGADLAELYVQTKSNVAFASGFDDNKITMQMVMPKMHLLEIKSAFETIIPQIKKHEELQRQKRKEEL
ncbi:MAG: hypothetical protein RQ760_01025 [Sedimentisphaerales bacterium]|nr:hypothetical protein [Sedimentisphaerales bacterium]